MQEESTVCSLKNPTVVYMIAYRLSSCKTGVYNARLLIILERGCSSMYRSTEGVSTSVSLLALVSIQL